MYMYMYMQNYTHCISFSRYAAARIEALRQANQLTPRSRFATWQPITVNEFHAFLAVILNVGLIDISVLDAKRGENDFLPTLGIISVILHAIHT